MRRIPLTLLAMSLTACQTTTGGSANAPAAEPEVARSAVSSSEAFDFFNETCLKNYPNFSAAIAEQNKIDPSAKAEGRRAVAPNRLIALSVDEQSSKRTECSMIYGTQETFNQMIAVEEAAFGKKLSAFGRDFQGKGIPVKFSGWGGMKVPNVNFYRLSVTHIATN